MDNSLFRVQTFLLDDSPKCACIITGYRGKIASYAKVIKLLNDKGYSVIAYEHSPSVLTQGDPKLLISLVKQLSGDFAKRTAGFQGVLCVGASIGAGLCFALQRQSPKVAFGIYAGAGVSPPETVYEAPLFYLVRKKFRQRGFDKAALQQAWAEVDILPTTGFAQTPFTIALGKRDKVVPYQKALTTLHAWQAKGQPIRIIPKGRLGHIGVIHWYKRHFSELLAEAEKQLASGQPFVMMNSDE